MDGWILTTLANTRVKHLGEYFVLTGGGNGIVVFEVYWVTLVVDEGHGLGLGDF